MSSPSRVFSGATIAMYESAVSISCRSIGGRSPSELERRLADEDAAAGVEAEPDERACAASGELAAHLLDERPRERLRADEHLPARLGLDALDEHACVGLGTLGSTSPIDRRSER